MKHSVKFLLNGEKVSISVEPTRKLVDVLREDLKLTGTKKGCGQGDCGACTVIIDRKPVNSCLVLARELEGKDITTIEGLSKDGRLHPIQQAFIDLNAIQCGFCTPGMIISSYSLLMENPNPTASEIRRYLQGNLCRCTGYSRIVRAVLEASRRLSGEKDISAISQTKRLEAIEKATGRALFAGDMKLPGMLVGRILRSEVPHARIKNIRTDRAASLPGVFAVITAMDFPDVRTGFLIKDEVVLAREKIRYIGEPLAAVAAIDAETAERALGLIEVDLKELPAVFTFSESVDPKSPLIHENFERYVTITNLIRRGNICCHARIRKGDVERGFADSDEIFEDVFKLPVVHQAPIEPRAAVAMVEPDGRLHVWCGTSRPFNIRAGLAEALGLPMSHIRVTATRIGGGFGGKGEMSIEPIAAMLAIKTRRPVKIEMTRKEDFTSGTPRHSMEIYLKTGVKKDGTILARQASLKVDTGAYAYFGPATTSIAMLLVAGPYRVPNLLIEGICAYTNKISCGPCRGPGAPQAHFAVETQMDRIARRLGLDPIELRIRNALDAGDTTATGQPITEAGYKEVLEHLRKSMQDQLVRLPSDDDGRAFGIGVAGCFWGIPGFGSSATLKLNEDGTAVLSLGSVEIGTGSDTAMALLVSRELGIPLDKIRVVSGDTDSCPFDYGAIGSRTTQAMGVAVHRAIAGVKEQLLSFAERLLEAPREVLAFGNERIYVKERPEKAILLATISRQLTLTRGGPVIAAGTHTAPNPPFQPELLEGLSAPTRPFFAFGAQAVAVKVDTVTGKVDVVKVIAAHNVGKAVFQEGVEGQIEGGVAMGLGYALTEEVIFSDGRPVNDSFIDYRLPTAVDVPEILPVVVEKGQGRSPEDILGVGEPPTAPTAAAVANAVFDAVGVRINGLPLTPERVYWAIKKLFTQEGFPR